VYVRRRGRRNYYLRDDKRIKRKERNYKNGS
jgi:hypothetical protein